MKKKHMIASLAVMAIITTGALGVSQPVNATNSTSIERKVTEKTPTFKSAHLEHYNVLRIELDRPIVLKNAFFQLYYGNSKPISESVPVVKNGATVAFDINLDTFAKNKPTKEERELIASSVHFRYITLSSPFRNEQTKINDKFVSQTLANAEDQGNMLADGRVDYVTNMEKLNSYSKIITEDGYADHLLNQRITTQTGGIGFKVNEAYKDGYEYSLTDMKGNVSGEVVFELGEMFVIPEGDKFLAKEYTISAKNMKTGTVLNIAKFTPFNVF